MWSPSQTYRTRPAAHALLHKKEHCVSTEVLRVLICLVFETTAWHAPCPQAPAPLQGTNLCCAAAHRMLLSGAWSSCVLASLTPSSWVRVL